MVVIKRTKIIGGIGAALIVCGTMFFGSVPVLAQGKMGGMEEGSGMMGMPGMRGKEQRQSMMAEMQRMHEQMGAMRQEMAQELQKQMTALREHTKAMEGITDEKQLMGEMKKHLQMTDEVLETMLEQREKMHANMKEHREQMRSRMMKGMEGSGTEQEEGPEAHH
jgi:hypothetical protein